MNSTPFSNSRDNCPNHGKDFDKDGYCCDCGYQTIYEKLTPQEQWAEDKRLGVLDAPDREQALRQQEDPEVLKEVVDRWLAGEEPKRSDYHIIAKALSQPLITHVELRDAHAQGYALGQQVECHAFVAALEDLFTAGPIDTLPERLKGLIVFAKESMK